MTETLDRIEHLKEELDAQRLTKGHLLPPQSSTPLDIELAYSSNAIAGNTLTLDETANVIDRFYGRDLDR